MRFALMGLASAFAVLALGVPSSDAQTFFNKRYCVFSGGGPNQRTALVSRERNPSARARPSAISR